MNEEKGKAASDICWSSPLMDPYHTLGIQPRAPESEVKKASNSLLYWFDS